MPSRGRGCPRPQLLDPLSMCLAETTHVFIDRRRPLQRLRRAAEEVRFSAAANSHLGAFVVAAMTGWDTTANFTLRSFSSDSQSVAR